MDKYIDSLLAQHCAPVLLSKKCAALFTMDVSWRALRPYLTQLYGQGVRFKYMGGAGARSRLLVYRPRQLEAALAAPEVRGALTKQGYPTGCALTYMLAHLRKRLEGAEGGFPHEVGFFLGYPADDVLGFMHHKGRAYKLSGPWKVYGDVQTARTMFRQYEECRRRLVAFVGAGGSVLAAAQLAV